ncbi:unnamed protein product [[Candida] boidinii]|uniref:Unnamed protein product n=1 Tax=Candida boidinii TaxID=5477 RepID=A0ACB5TI82_CANBO|nr:unnamed protein product [[Candida] boidinii]
MAKPTKNTKKPGSLQKETDNKVYNLILDLLEEKSVELREKHQDEDKSNPDYNPYKSIALAKDLEALEIFQYCRTKERSFLRMKEVQLRDSIERIWKVIKDDEFEEMKSLGVDPDINNSEKVTLADLDDDGEELMEVRDMNQANKSIVSMWNLPSNTESSNENEDAEQENDDEKSGSVTAAASTTIASTKPETSSNTTTKKSKKRSKDSDEEKSTKKLKIKDRTPPTLKLSSLGGLDDIVTQLMEVVGLPILHPEIYLSTGISPPRGVLLHGPPGCGKTTIANALAGELQVPFISLSAPSVVSGMSGESEKKVRSIFEEAKQLAPCLVFFDEIDAITPKRDGGAQREMERRIVAQLLTSMDELSLEKTDGKPVIVIGATNRPDSLDAALRRAGRFDREICINVPNELSRYNILEAMTKELKINGDLHLMKIAKMTPGFVGADLKALVTAAGIAAIKRIFTNMNDVDKERLLDEGERQQEELIKQTQDQIEQEQPESMEIDDENDKKEELSKQLTVLGTNNNPIMDIESFSKLSTIQKFLLKHPVALTNEQLEPLSITQEDFETALPTIQPTAKREGFATIPDVTWKNVGALSKIRVELHMAIVQPIKRPEIYERVGITAPAGVLMWGPPGCGKTLLAKAVANESKANFISVKGPELLNKYVGESEKAVRQVFARARASVPCIIFFDELDALVPRRDTSLSESSSRVVNTLLTELDGLNDRNGIFVVGATNRPDMIDPAMLRPGRLDKTLYIELPTASERLDILKTLINANGTPISNDVNLESIAHDERCRNFSGADLSSLVREAGVIALKRKFFKGISSGDERISKFLDAEDNDIENGADAIGSNSTENIEPENSSSDIVVTNEDFSFALNSVKPSVSDRDRQKYEKLNKRLGWSKTEVEEPIDESKAL